ncbi:MAG: PilZ domain-containing protein [Phycisphaerae bacterium]|nr:PilZ domain-containing protein [Phycisphaerae bacterium]
MGHARERRKHRRLGIRLPIECVGTLDGGQVIYRTVTHDVCSGGVCFEADSNEFAVGTSLEMELEVPPGDGHSPYPGRVRGAGRVVRVDRLGEGGAQPRFRIATNFTQRLKVVF